MTLTAEQAAAWEAEGRRLAPALDPIAAVVVAGADVDAAAHLALGIAAGQSTRRRVAVADLTGQATPLTQLVPDLDPHGLADTFAFGVSLNRVARQVDRDGRLFVIPAGTEPVLRPGGAIHDRWRRIVDGFRDVGAILLLVAPSDAPGVAELIQRTDGLVAVGEDPATTALPHRIVTASLRQPVEAPPTPSTRRTPVITPATSAGPMRSIMYVVGAIVVIAALLWLASRVGGSGARGGMLGSDSAAAVSPDSDFAGDSAAGVRSDSAGIATDTVNGTAASAELPVPPVANLADSARAAAFSVAVATVGSEQASVEAFRGRSRALASVTIGQASDGAGGTNYYLVTWAGDSAGKAVAELERLRRQGLVARTAGAVIQLPYALQVESSVPLDSVRTRLNQLLARGVPAYALLQPNGRAHVYVGAFATPADSRAQLVNLQSAAIPAALVVRTGRPL